MPSHEEMKRMQFARYFQSLTRDFLGQLSYLLLPTPVDAWLSAVIAVSESM